MKRAAYGVLLALVLALQPPQGPARAETALPPEFADALVATGLSRPVNFDFLPDGRILVVEQWTGRIRLVVPGAPVQPGPVGTVSDVRAVHSDEGLLGIAVDPRWPASPYVYVHHAAASSPNIRIARYALTGDLSHRKDGALLLDSLSRRDVLGDLPDDSPLHDGGTLEFGPDDLLYVALGDDEVPCAAQDIHQMRGKILRLDVRVIPAGPGPILPYAWMVPPGNPYASDPDPRARLVWHRGLRNPWSFDFDPRSGAMAIADVGLVRWEEIDVTSAPGRNFGWPLFEGPDVFETECTGVDLANLTFPAHAYARDTTAAAACILGGICFRADDVGESFPVEYWGNVFFLDFFAGRLQRLVPEGDDWVLAPPVGGQPDAEAWGTGFAFTPRMRFGPDGGLWYLQGPHLRRIEFQGVVGVPDTRAAGATRLELAARPTPARGPVTLEFRLDEAARAELDIFDITGRHVRRLGGDEVLPAGMRHVTWDGRDDAGNRAAPGVYLARLAAGGERAQRRLVLVAGTSAAR